MAKPLVFVFIIVNQSHHKYSIDKTGFVATQAYFYTNITRVNYLPCLHIMMFKVVIVLRSTR